VQEIENIFIMISSAA